MGRVASEIAHGNLSRRVSPANERTEVGRLGTSLNEMLGQIEQAFADRSESEDRLRRFLVRRVARAAHAARVDPRLRRAVSPRRRQRPGRARTGDGQDRGGGDQDGRPGREPAAARAPRGAAGDAARAGRPARARRARRAGHAGGWRRTGRSCSMPRARCRCSGIRSSCVRCSPTSPATR